MNINDYWQGQLGRAEAQRGIVDFLERHQQQANAAHAFAAAAMLNAAFQAERLPLPPSIPLDAHRWMLDLWPL